MKTKIVKISYKKEHHRVDLNEIESLHQLRTKIHKIFTQLPVLYELINDGNYRVPLNQKDF